MPFFNSFFEEKFFLKKVTDLLKKNVFLHPQNMAIVAQLVRVPDCGSEGRGFESHQSPQMKSQRLCWLFFYLFNI